MVVVSLTADMQVAGESLLRELDRLDLDVRACLWLRPEEQASWRLLVVSTLVDRDGPKALYRRIRAALSRSRPGQCVPSFTDVWVRSNEDPFVRALRVKLGPIRDISGKHIGSVTINGYYLEEAYVYRLI